ncbi:polyamine-modulated factor 1-like [Coturnix japonica]|uniref:polyamine-modulated factor 1-like n=1 Tax=Coturnix japonica TaxID=93934 RepID=UPI0013A5EEFF|nr:polyamine-modulated factor 1-like [Coturnix japonica]
MAEAAAGQDGGTGRAELMAAVLDAFSERLLAAGSYDRFARCYRRFYRALPHVTRSIHQQFVAQLRDHVTVSGDGGGVSNGGVN